MQAPCPQCGQPGHCRHCGNVGASDEYHDRYEFSCGNPQCGLETAATVYAGTISGANWYTRCPYCHRSGQ